MNSHLKKALSEMDNPYYLGFRRSAREIIDAILVDNEIDFEKILKERTLSFHNNDSANRRQTEGPKQRSTRITSPIANSKDSLSLCA